MENKNEIEQLIKNMLIDLEEFTKTDEIYKEEMIDGKAEVNQKRCLGYGKCETTCPNGAISIFFDDISRIDEFINTLESYVDVT